MDIAEEALNFINKYMEEMQKPKEFRSRVRDLCPAAYFDGLKPTIIFALSKATEKKVEEFYHQRGENNFSETEEGYGFFVLAILRFIEQLSDIDKHKLETHLVDGLLDILKNNKSIENKILIYLKWLKYFTEAKVD